MFKGELVREVSRDTRYSQEVVSDVLNSTLKAIQKTLTSGLDVTIPGFGTFYTSERPAGTVRHVTSGEELTYPARRVAAFRAGEVLKKAVRGKRGRRTTKGISADE